VTSSTSTGAEGSGALGAPGAARGSAIGRLGHDEVFEAICAGASGSLLKPWPPTRILEAIAGRLNLSYHTVGNHLRNIDHKLHVRSRSSAVAKALREDLV